MMNWVIPPVASNLPPPKVENMNIENKLKNNLVSGEPPPSNRSFLCSSAP